MFLAWSIYTSGIYCRLLILCANVHVFATVRPALPLPLQLSFPLPAPLRLPLPPPYATHPKEFCSNSSSNSVQGSTTCHGFLHLHQQQQEEQHQEEQQQEPHVCSMLNYGEYVLSKGEERIGMHTPAELGKSTSRHTYY